MDIALKILRGVVRWFRNLAVGQFRFVKNISGW